MSRASIKNQLLEIGAVDEDTIEIFAKRTRDCDNLTVYRDTLSGVIFINDFYIGDEVYNAGDYRGDGYSRATSQTYEDICDAERRFETYKKFTCGKTICDFGCGAGDFLKLSRNISLEACGVELQKNFVDKLVDFGISCTQSMPAGKIFDVVTLFHVLEHLPEPRKQLRELYNNLKPNGAGFIIVEVPHANDFLVKHMACKNFVDFTLWSQHLILHTRDSLQRFLLDAGFKNIKIEGIQRYGISNHLTWLKDGKPGGHKSTLGIFETDELTVAYANALSKVDACDTLVAIAST